MDRRLAPIRGVALPVHVCSAGELMPRVYARSAGSLERFALLDARQKNFSIREERPARQPMFHVKHLFAHLRTAHGVLLYEHGYFVY